MLRIAWLLALGSLAQAAAPALMPMPQKVELAAGKLAIDAGFTIAAAGPRDARLESAMRRFRSRISLETGISLSANQPAGASEPTLRVECDASGPEYPTLGEDESYTLDVAPQGARLKAASIEGALHGLETFAQLIEPGAGGFQVPALHIEDRPRFPWRGLLLDVARHWMPITVVKRNLDAMAAVKLNVFHWHLSDDQGFRVESRRFPRLQELGSDGLYYTQAEIREVVAYARDRGIRVLPEFDMPGHVTSWLVGYPELASAPGPYEVERHFGGFDGAMDPTREETYEFLDSFLGEITPLFPDAFFHIGGDEVNGNQWNQSAAIQAFARAHHLDGTIGIQTYFNQRVQAILEKYGKTMVGWDEILHEGLAPGTVIQTWRGQAALADSVSKGYRGVLSWGYYLDRLRPARYHYAIDPLGGAAAQLKPEEAARILGGEACMWGELVDAENVDSRIWPRTAVIAERLWSPALVTDADSMYERLERVSRRLAWTGVEDRANYQPMLDRLSGDRPAEALRVLADASEALGLGPRKVDHNTTATPLNRLVDAARPESESVRLLEQAAARVAATRPISAEDLKLLREQFTRWAENDARFQKLADGNELLAELKQLSKDLSELGTIGLRALDYLARGVPPPQGWVAHETMELERIQKPDADLALAAARPVKVLVGGLAKGKR
jgi:hexosaminidase